MSTKNAKVLYFVVPCYNEEECLDKTTELLKKKLNSLAKAKKISADSKIVYIDDGSKDATWKKIAGYDSHVIGLKLSHNRGHQNALLAGLMFARERADITISMDADLQDSIEAVDEFIAKHEDEGCEIVYGVRSSRKKDSFFKRTTALAFYRVMNWLGAETVYNSADYRLISKRALDELANFKEVNLFLRGLVPLLGFKSDIVEYERNERFAGESKYPLKKMLSFAWDGITSFSVKPIRMVLSVGIITFILSLAVTIYSIVVKLLGSTVDGWTFIMCSLWLLGGIQMISLGLVGEYVGKIYAEVKQRPRFIIETIKETK